ncbi:histone acetyltransferase Esa1p [Trichomonascus vanleenenianus]|uniref:NuA4 histone acetyltransferase complex catalytic subunit ESA1 n=1 Tax=Trichomonascus vanleenenianus TaxID=2268995 RepID=UPI003EC9EBD3
MSEVNSSRNTPVSDFMTNVQPDELQNGWKVYVEKDGEKRRAEILSVQKMKDGTNKFYVHYEEFNKRLDEWVRADRIDLSRPVEIPRPEKKRVTESSEKSKSKLSKVANKGRGNKAPKKSTPSTAATTPGSADDKDMMDMDEINPNGSAAGEFNREEEIEKLRTSGSMTQNAHEVSRVRNLQKIVMGEHEIEPWYFSPYPIELTEEEVIYICEFTLSYFGSKKQFERFRAKCTLRHPPGNEIYRDDKVSFFEIDGRRQRTWCRNLCLLSKLFLDHKTLYYDVDPFLFYCMTVRDDRGHHLVGYFSKEKESAEGYNVACILTLPQYQRHGYGRVLIDFSYNLSLKENKQGSPEKPLSDLGLLSYRAYWSARIVELLMEGGAKREMTIDDIATQTAMTTTDILHTLQTLNVLKYYRGQHIICITEAVEAKYEREKGKKRIRIDAEKLHWKPPVFTAAQLRFAW